MSQKEAAEYFNRMNENLLGGINTCLPGEIENYDPITNKANVLLHPDGNMILDVPVGIIQTEQFFVRVPLQPGDKVLVVFAQRDIDSFMHDEDATPTDRMLSMDDAFVIAGINLFNEPLPAEDADKLVIGQKDGSAKLTMGEGKISLIGEIEITGNVKAQGDFIMQGGTITANGEDLTTDLT